MIRRRLGKGVMGFKTTEDKVNEEEKSKNEILKLSEPEDLLGFGLIPEFVGRLPIISSLQELSSAQLVKILTEPKNAMVKQYQKLIALEGAELNLTKDALEALAELAVKRGTGARALRSIFLKNLCWISCMNYQAIRISKKSQSTERLLKEKKVL